MRMIRVPDSNTGFDVMGTMSMMLPELLGSSKLVDRATEYVLASHLVYKRLGLGDGPENLNGALSSGAKAMQSLRQAIEDPQQTLSDEVLIATKLLFMAEVDYHHCCLDNGRGLIANQVFRGLRNQTHCVHQVAFCELIRARRRSGKARQVDEYLALVSYFEEVGGSFYIEVRG